jgi:uncharacterized protein (DUF433 family)
VTAQRRLGPRKARRRRSVLATVQADDGWAVREIPDLKHIEVDPEMLGGRPVIRGQRIPAEEVAELAAAEGGVDDLKKRFGVTESEIRDATRWWTLTQRFANEAA